MTAYMKRASGLLTPMHRLLGTGTYHGLIVRNGKVIDEFECKNLVVNQGLDHILSVEFSGAAQVTAWYLAPFTGNYTPVATDTAGSISSNSTESVAYTSTTRVPYVNVEANQQVTNAASTANFTFTSSANIYGAFLVSAPTKNSTSGILFSAAQFTAPKNVSSGDQLLLTYQFAAAST